MSAPKFYNSSKQIGVGGPDSFRELDGMEHQSRISIIEVIGKWNE